MARKQQKITFEIYLDGERVEKIPPEAKAGMMKRMGEAMSLYYTQHPEEYELLLKGGENHSRAPYGEVPKVDKVSFFDVGKDIKQ